MFQMQESSECEEELPPKTGKKWANMLVLDEDSSVKYKCNPGQDTEQYVEEEGEATKQYTEKSNKTMKITREWCSHRTMSYVTCKRKQAFLPYGCPM